METVFEEWGMRCPMCGSDESIRIEITVLAALTADGTEPDGDHTWTPESWANCRACEFSGTVLDFTVDELPQAKKGV